MNLASVLADFFDSLEASDWLTLVIAVASAGISVWAIVESKRVRDKPLLLVEDLKVSHNDPSFREPDWMVEEMTGPGATMHFANRGNGVAHNVIVVLHSPGLDAPETIADIGIFAPGDVHEVGFMLSTEEYRDEVTDDGVDTRYWIVYRPRYITQSEVSIVFTWRQEPNMKKLRTMTVGLPAS